GVPGAAVSPGARICNLTKAAELSGIDELVLLVIPVCVVSEAVTVALPPVLSVTLKLFVPAERAAFAGNTAFGSLEVIAPVSFVLIKFQFASTALTVTLKAVPAFCTVGVPLLPVAEPGAAVSPGANTCNFAKAPTLTVIEGLVFAVLVGSLTSERV